MADDTNNTFLFSSAKIVQKLIESMNKTTNLSKTLKSEVENGLMELKNIIINQSSIINKQKTDFCNELKALTERHIEVFSNVNNHLEDLKSLSVVKSYSSVVKSGSTDHREQQSKHVVLIRHSDKTKTSKQTEDLIKSKVRPNSLNIGIKSKRYVSNGGIIIECRDRKECEVLSQEIESKFNDIKAEKPFKRRPTLVLRDVNPSIPQSELIDLIISNNSEIKNYFENTVNDKSNELSIKFKFRKKDSKINDKYCLEVSPHLRKIILKSGKLFIEWNACRVEESLPIVRCFRCNGFGHKSMDCSENEHQCGHCGSKHETNKCSANKDQSFCTNCNKHNMKPNQKNKYDVNHSAYSKSCPSLIRIQEIVKNKTQYE
jgi:hypothetical protein